MARDLPRAYSKSLRRSEAEAAEESTEKGAPLQAAVPLLHGHYRPREIGNAVRVGEEELAGFVEIRLVFFTRNK